MLSKSLHLFTLFKIPVGLNYSFFLTAGLISIFYGLHFMGLYILIATCVLAHEFGHALVGKKLFNIDCEYIALHALGGVASMEAPKNNREEIFISIAGPAVNFFIFLLLVPIARATDNFLITYLAAINLVIGLFNLIPAFPTDGGRILRASLSHYLGYYRATKLTIFVSRTISSFGFVLAISMQWWMLAIVSIFIFLLSFQEEKALTCQEP